MIYNDGAEASDQGLEADGALFAPADAVREPLTSGTPNDFEAANDVRAPLTSDDNEAANDVRVPLTSDDNEAANDVRVTLTSDDEASDDLEGETDMDDLDEELQSLGTIADGPEEARRLYAAGFSQQRVSDYLTQFYGEPFSRRQVRLAIGKHPDGHRGYNGGDRPVVDEEVWDLPDDYDDGLTDARTRVGGRSSTRPTTPRQSAGAESASPKALPWIVGGTVLAFVAVAVVVRRKHKARMAEAARMALAENEEESKMVAYLAATEPGVEESGSAGAPDSSAA